MTLLCIPRPLRVFALVFVFAVTAPVSASTDFERSASGRFEAAMEKHLNQQPEATELRRRLMSSIEHRARKLKSSLWFAEAQPRSVWSAGPLEAFGLRAEVLAELAYPDVRRAIQLDIEERLAAPKGAPPSVELRETLARGIARIVEAVTLLEAYEGHWPQRVASSRAIFSLLPASALFLATIIAAAAVDGLVAREKLQWILFGVYGGTAFLFYLLSKNFWGQAQINAIAAAIPTWPGSDKIEGRFWKRIAELEAADPEITKMLRSVDKGTGVNFDRLNSLGMALACEQLLANENDAP